MESPRRRIAYSAGSTVRATPNRPPSPATRRKCRRWTCDVETRVATRPGVLANHRKAAVPPVGRTGPLAGRTCSCHRSAPNSRLVCRSEWLEIPGTVTVLLSARIAWACSHLSSATLISRSRPRLVRKKSIEGALPNRSCLLRHRLEGCLTWPRLAKRRPCRQPLGPPHTGCVRSASPMLWPRNCSRASLSSKVGSCSPSANPATLACGGYLASLERPDRHHCGDAAETALAVIEPHHADRRMSLRLLLEVATQQPHRPLEAGGFRNDSAVRVIDK